jgi:ribosomal protein S18 acetylase RimI-like enzyme
MTAPQWSIRLLRIEDWEAVFRLWSGSAGMGLRPLDDSPAGIRRFIERNPQTCFVAELPRSAGAKQTIAGVILSGHDGRRGYIYHMAVSAEFRRHGIGRTLVSAVETAMAVEGIHKIALVAFKTNEEGNRFWEKIGYARRDDLYYRNKSINPENGE